MTARSDIDVTENIENAVREAEYADTQIDNLLSEAERTFGPELAAADMAEQPDLGERATAHSPVLSGHSTPVTNVASNTVIAHSVLRLHVQTVSGIEEVEVAVDLLDNVPVTTVSHSLREWDEHVYGVVPEHLEVNLTEPNTAIEVAEEIWTHLGRLASFRRPLLGEHSIRHTVEHIARNDPVPSYNRSPQPTEVNLDPLDPAMDLGRGPINMSPQVVNFPVSGSSRSLAQAGPDNVVVDRARGEDSVRGSIPVLQALLDARSPEHPTSEAMSASSEDMPDDPLDEAHQVDHAQAAATGDVQAVGEQPLQGQYQQTSLLPSQVEDIPRVRRALEAFNVPVGMAETIARYTHVYLASLTQIAGNSIWARIAGLVRNIAPGLVASPNVGRDTDLEAQLMTTINRVTELERAIASFNAMATPALEAAAAATQQYNAAHQADLELIERNAALNVTVTTLRDELARIRERASTQAPVASASTTITPSATVTSNMFRVRNRPNRM